MAPFRRRRLPQVAVALLLAVPLPTLGSSSRVASCSRWLNTCRGGSSHGGEGGIIRRNSENVGLGAAEALARRRHPMRAVALGGPGSEDEDEAEEDDTRFAGGEGGGMPPEASNNEDGDAAPAAEEHFEGYVVVGVEDSEGEGEGDGGGMSGDDDGEGSGAASGEEEDEEVGEGEGEGEGSGDESHESEAAQSEEAEESMERAKAAWRAKATPPPEHKALEEVVAETRRKQKAMLAAGPSDSGPADNGEDSTIYRLLLSELHGESTAATAVGARWIDADALLQLRGAAALAHSPALLRHTQRLPRVSRGVRVAARDATHDMQEALARALAHATGAKLLAIDDAVLEEVRRAAAGSDATAAAGSGGVTEDAAAAAAGAEGKGKYSAPATKERMSTRQALAALSEAMREDGSPFVVFLRDKGTAVLRSRGGCAALSEELRNRRSRALFLLSTTSDPAAHGGGRSLTSAPQQSMGNPPGQPPGGGGGFPGGPFPPGMGMNMPPGMSMMPPGMPNGMMPGQFMPMMPPGSSTYWAQGPPDPKNPNARSFYLVSQTPMQPPGGANGTRRGPPGQPNFSFPGGQQPFGMPPPQVLRKMLDEAMAMMKDRENNMDNDDSDDEDSSAPPSGPGSNNNNDPQNNNGMPPGFAMNLAQTLPGVVDALRELLKDDGVKKMLEEMSQDGSGQAAFNIVVGTPQQMGGGEGGGDVPQQQGGDGSGRPALPSKPAWLAGMRKSIVNKEEGQGGKQSDANNDAAVAAPAVAQEGGGDGDDGGAMEVTPTPQELKSVLGMFEDLVVLPPGDAVLRRHWDKWVADDVGRHNAQQNRQLLTAAMRANDLRCPELRKLDPLLAKHRLNQEEVGAVVLAALKAEVSKLEGFGGSGTAATAAAASGRRSTSTSSRQSNRLHISLASMELAFATVCRAHVARPGQPLSRTREEVAALAQQDRHEQALVTNVILPRDIGVTYDQIGGLREAKELLRQCITYPLKFPHLYSEGIAQEAVKGVLLFGPPGTGKTMLAKAVATEGGATFLSIDASVIENKWLGESEKNARAVFTLARRLAPCVVYLDEVDSVLSSREKYDDTTHGTLTSVKTTLMQEWDGLRTTGDRVVVIASTNRPFDLDEAVLRRLPRRIMVDLPDAETREEILRVTMANNRVSPSVNFTQIAVDLDGFTGSDIKEVCREAVVRIAHERAQQLETGMLLAAGGGDGDSADAAAADGTAAAAAAADESLEEDPLGLTARLRPVTMEDFNEARKRLTTSVSEKGRELARVWEWNEEYGEIKKQRPETSKHHLSMYL